MKQYDAIMLLPDGYDSCVITLLIDADSLESARGLVYEKMVQHYCEFYGYDVATAEEEISAQDLQLIALVPADAEYNIYDLESI